MAARKSAPALAVVVDRLRAHYGRPVAPAVTDPFEQILLEQVAYLANDVTRRAAFKLLATSVGLKPDNILAATKKTLLAAASKGGAIAADERVARMRESAKIVRDQYGGSLAGVLALPAAEARKALAQFPMIGKPGAEKILLFAGKSNGLALDSNGLRVLLRVGYGAEDRNYDRAYRSVVADAHAQAPMERPRAIATYLLLREHGKALCGRTSPDCEECPLKGECAYARRAGRAT